MTRLPVTFQIFCALLLAIGTQQQASAAVAFEQISQPIGNPHSGSVGVASAFVEQIIEQSAAYDNFTLSSSTEISGIEWTGAYNEVFATSGADRGTTNFLIEFYPNAGGNRPDLSSVLATYTLNGGTSGVANGADIQKTIIPDQLQEDGGAVVRYEANLTPFSLDPGEYWITIQSQQTITNALDPEWLWAFSNEGDKRFFSYDEVFDPVGTQPGLAFPRDAAFTLLSSTTSGLFGDFNGNGTLDAPDIDLLSAQIRGGSSDGKYDLNNDGNVNFDDHAFWVSDVFGTLPGDADLNKEVTFLDFLALANNFGQTGGWADGEFNGDGTVRFNDFVALAQNYGLSAAASAEPTTFASSVPEPSSSLYTFLIPIVGMIMFRRRDRKSLDVAVVGIKLWKSR